MGSGAPIDVVDFLIRRGFDPNTQDPRVGSSRDNATSTSTLKAATGTNSSSFSTLFMTFVPVAIYAAVCTILFVTLRPRFPRVYAPRSFLSSLQPHERTEKLPPGWIKWVKAFYKMPDTAVLHHSSLDGFLFLRYLKILCIICGVGCVLTWLILLPLHRYGGNGNEQLDMLTFGNISKPQWYYVHAFLGWLYFGFILYMISRECVYFINLRQAYMLSPYYANRLSSRTILFTCVPKPILEERKLRKLFGDSVKNVWIPRETKQLDQLVKERDQTASRLEKAEITLIKTANQAYQKALKNGHPDISTERHSQDSQSKDSQSKELDSSVTSTTYVNSPRQSIPNNETDQITSIPSPSSPRSFLRIDGTPGKYTSYGPNGPPDVNGSVAAQWIPHSWRPVHRPLANFGRRVDTIKWSRNQLKELAPKISKLRREHKKGKTTPIAAAFIEFDSQINAQSAYQTLAHHRANHMVPDVVGIRPHEIVWDALRMHWWERIIRRFLVQGFIATMVIFWSIPAALIGIVSNVKFLTSKVFFLHWIIDLPSELLGLIEGLVPALALSALMACVPYLMRWCARQAGVPTLSKIELFTQNSYFVFEVVQVFLVTTLTSAASAAFTQILENPMVARTLLSQNLPKASNFYISYFILQGLAMSATRIVHVGSLWRHHVMGYTGTPRFLSRRYHRLRVIHWGAVYPVFTNMGVIAISYSLIAPIILGVAFIGLNVVYVSYRYNLLYVYSSEVDTRGLHYPRALTQTLTGVYLAEVCMVGLFGLRSAFGPLILMIGLIIFTALIHVSLNDALNPLLNNLPRTLAVEEELRRSGHAGLENLSDKEDDFDVEDPDFQNPYDSDFDPSQPNDAAAVHHDPNPGTRGIRMTEGTDQLATLTLTGLKTFVRAKYRKSRIPGYISKVDFWSYWITPDPSIEKPNFLLKWLHPEIFADYAIVRASIPEYPDIVYEPGSTKDAYHPPSVRSKPPTLWIPRDVAGVSAQEVRHSGAVIAISDEGAWIDEKNRLSLDIESDRREPWEKVRY